MKEVISFEGLMLEIHKTKTWLLWIYIMFERIILVLTLMYPVRMLQGKMKFCSSYLRKNLTIVFRK